MLGSVKSLAGGGKHHLGICHDISTFYIKEKEDYSVHLCPYLTQPGLQKKQHLTLTTLVSHGEEKIQCHMNHIGRINVFYFILYYGCHP